MARLAISLLGRDFPQLGALGVVCSPHGGSLALSRGREPKAYPHVDPNEDAALLVHAPSGSLLAVADGYNGAAAAELAIAGVERAAGELLAQPATRFRTRIEALVQELGRALHGVEPSRTCLLVAVLGERHCHFASFGDSGLYRARRSGLLNTANGLALRAGSGARPRPEELWYGGFEREPGERVALVSDGIIDFFPDPGRIPALLDAAPDDGAAATLLAAGALDAGAGDNVAVALLGDAPSRS